MIEQKPIFFPGLNGLRAIASIAVVAAHTMDALKDFHLDPYLLGTLKNGKPVGLSMAPYGVTIFFVLSGFLITYLLQVEKDNNPIDIKKFYIRRILRIWPLYYLYLLLALVVSILAGIHIYSNLLPFYLFYLANIPYITGSTLRFLGHYWSLGSEEQFYMYWPWFNKKVNTNVVPVIFLLIFTLIMAKICFHFLLPDSYLFDIIHTLGIESMLLGAVGAILYKQQNMLFLKITNNIISQSISWIVIFLIIINKFHIASVIDNNIVGLVGLTIIIGQIKIDNRLINLNTSVFDFLGKISYGIYVVHPLVIFAFSLLLGTMNIPIVCKYIIVFFGIIATTILLAYLSYTYFEKYFLTLKKRFVVIASTNTKT